jgi:hypothetical protein
MPAYGVSCYVVSLLLPSRGLFGPFGSRGEASAWAARTLEPEDWSVLSVYEEWHKPDSEEFDAR